MHVHALPLVHCHCTVRVHVTRYRACCGAALGRPPGCSTRRDVCYSVVTMLVGFELSTRIDSKKGGTRYPDVSGLRSAEAERLQRL